MSIRVGVLRGGVSSEYEVSLLTGQSVLNNLPKHYTVKDILIDSDGVFIVDGFPVDLEYLSRNVDVIFNALHGFYGEDGKIQKELDYFKIPYTGSSVWGSIIGMNKIMAKAELKKLGVKVPRHIILKREQKENAGRLVFNTFSLPVVVKIPNGGSSVGVEVVKDFYRLDEILKIALDVLPEIIIEEYIKGREATCGVIENFREQKYYTLPPIEIKLPKEKFFDYDAKYKGGAEEICPANFSQKEKREIEKLAKLAHQSLGLRHYSRSDFIVARDGIYFLETNTLPSLTKESLLPKALDAVGSNLEEFTEHIIDLALKRK